MKRLTGVWILLLCLLGSPFVADAQDDGVFRSFTGSIEGTTIRLTWAVTMGAECADLEIQHSTNGVDFETKFIFPGACGSNYEDKFYSFVDSFPTPLVENHYRLRHNIGLETASIKIPYRFLPPNHSLTNFPNPADDRTEIVFDNPNRKWTTYQLFSADGKLLDEQAVNYGNSFPVDCTVLEPGVYYYRMTLAGETPLVGKLVVAH